MLIMKSNKIIQHYLETQGLDHTCIKEGKIFKNAKKQLVQKTSPTSVDYIQIENTCDRIINNIDKLLNYIKNE